MSNSKKFVTVATNPTTGLVITPSVNKPTWGSIRVDSVHVTMENGLINRNKRSAFLRGLITDLEAIGYSAGQQIPGQIIRKESFTPFYVAGVNGATKTQDPKINPTTKAVVLTDDRETYLESEFTQNLEATDVWIGELPMKLGGQVVGATIAQTEEI